MRNSYKLGVFNGLASGALWGADTALSNLIFLMAPFVMVDPRMIAPTLLIAFLHDFSSAMWLSGDVVVRRKTGSLWQALKTRNARVVMIAAMFGGPIGMRAYLYAIDTLGPGYTASISSLYPAVAAVLGFLFLKDKLSGKGWIGLLLSITAVVILGTSSDFGSLGDHALFGFYAALVCTLGWALESVICAYGMKGDDVSPKEALFIRQLTSSVVYLVLMFFEGDALYSLGQVFQQPSALYVFLIAAVGTMSYLCYYASIDTIGPVKATGLNVTYSIWTVIFGLFLQSGDNAAGLDLKLIVCSLMIIAGSVLVSQKD